MPKPTTAGQYSALRRAAADRHDGLALLGRSGKRRRFGRGDRVSAHHGQRNFPEAYGSRTTWTCITAACIPCPTSMPEPRPAPSGIGSKTTRNTWSAVFGDRRQADDLRSLATAPSTLCQRLGRPVTATSRDRVVPGGENYPDRPQVKAKVSTGRATNPLGCDQIRMGCCSGTRVVLSPNWTQKPSPRIWCLIRICRERRPLGHRARIRQAAGRFRRAAVDVALRTAVVASHSARAELLCQAGKLWPPTSIGKSTSRLPGCESISASASPMKISHREKYNASEVENSAYV